MGMVLEGCDYIIVKKACKNTANAFTSHGVKILKYSSESLKTEAILREISSLFI